MSLFDVEVLVVFFTFFRKKGTMKSFIFGLGVLLGISSYADAQYIVQPQRYYNNGYRQGYVNGYTQSYNNNYRYNNNNGYNNGYNNYGGYGYNGFDRYVTPSGYRPFDNPYFRMATQGIGGW